MNFDLPKNENLQTPESKIKEGVNFVFEQNLELAKIGTEQVYSKYLDSIFPESKIKDILWHGGEEGIDIFTTDRETKKYFFGLIQRKEVGAYFSNTIETAINYKELKSMFKGEEKSKVYSVVIDAKNPYIITSRLDDRSNPLKIRSEFITEKEREILFKNGYDSVVREYEYVVFNPNQINIIGSQSDIEKFKEFVSNMNQSK
jgi:hypothetical protein